MNLFLRCCINYLFYSVKMNLFLQISYTEEFEHQRGKGSFPAMITPGYCLAKKAQENASDVSIDRSIGSLHLISNLIWHSHEIILIFVGWNGDMATTAMPSAGNTDVCSNANYIPVQLKYKKDLNKMKGTSHFHSLTSEDNLALKNARKINKIISEVSLLFPADS